MSYSDTKFDLKPCPFCGEKPEIRGTSNGMSSKGANRFAKCYKIWCPNCGCSTNRNVEVTLDYFPHIGVCVNEEELINECNKWNGKLLDDKRNEI